MAANLRIMAARKSLWRQALSWFPGHVAKARKDMIERLANVDLVLEVRDARAPRSSGSTNISAMLAETNRMHRRIIVINKSDLVTERQRARIARWMDEDEPGVSVFFTSATEPTQHFQTVRQLLLSGIDQVHQQAPRLFKAGAQSRVARSISEHAADAAGRAWIRDVQSLPLILMVVGVPNVGKSSLINAARRIAAADADVAKRSSGLRLAEGRLGDAITQSTLPMRKSRSRAPVTTGKMPGVTRSLSGFQVSWQPDAWCLDTPGVLAPRIDGGWEAAIRLGALDLLKYDHDAEEGVAAYLLHYLSRCDAAQLERWPRAYALARRGPDALAGASVGGGHSLAAFDGGAPSSDELVAGVDERFALTMLEAVALDMKAVIDDDEEEAGVMADTPRAATELLNMFRRGNLGKVCFDTMPLADAWTGVTSRERPWERRRSGETTRARRRRRVV